MIAKRSLVIARVEDVLGVVGGGEEETEQKSSAGDWIRRM